MRDRAQDETEEQKARLQRMRDRVQDETEEEREARLEQMRANQRARLLNETEEERQARLEQRRGASDTPLLQQRNAWIIPRSRIIIAQNIKIKI